MSDNLHSTDKNLESHVQTYEGMLALFKWGIIFSAVVLIGLALVFVPKG
jgi:hypothetical protein